MIRSSLLSALVLVLATAVPACGGSSPDAQSPEQATGDAGEAPVAASDPLDDLKALSDGLQKDVDALVQPVNDANDVIDRVVNMPKELKGAKKFNKKKYMVEATKVAQGKDPDIESLALEPDAKAKVQDAFDKFKAVVAGIADLDTKIKAVTDELTAAATKAPTLIAKVTADATVVTKNPLKSADEKKKAEDKIKAASDIKDGFTKKSADWQKSITDLPAKGKTAGDKIAKNFVAAATK